jgi:hypothetical protein
MIRYIYFSAQGDMVVTLTLSRALIVVGSDVTC